MAQTITRRLVDTVRQSLSLEGLVAALVGGGVWAISAGVLTQATSVRIGPAIAVGAGFGLLAAAAFVWLVVRPDRARHQERDGVLKSSARKSLEQLADEGRYYASRLFGDEQLRAWRRDVESFLLEAFGRDIAAEFLTLRSSKEQVNRLDDLRRHLDDLCLHPGFRGWSRRGG